MLIAQITDLHMRTPGDKAYGIIDPAAFLAPAVRALNGVRTCFILENVTEFTDGNGLPPHSIEVVVEGGDMSLSGIDAQRDLQVSTNDIADADALNPDQYRLDANVIHPNSPHKLRGGFVTILVVNAPADRFCVPTVK